ncbi:MAG: hypothetical protein AAF483_14240 [Planctomycetota bacterium]
MKFRIMMKLIPATTFLAVLSLGTVRAQDWSQSVSSDPEVRAVALKGIELMVQFGKSESQAQQQIRGIFGSQAEVAVTNQVISKKFPSPQQNANAANAFVQTYVRVGLEDATPQKRDAVLQVFDGVIQEMEMLSAGSQANPSAELRGQYRQLLHDTAEVQTERRGEVNFEYRKGAFGYEHCQWNYASSNTASAEIPESQVTLTKYPGEEPIGKVRFAMALEQQAVQNQPTRVSAKTAAYRAPNVCEYQMGKEIITAELAAPEIVELSGKQIAVYEQELFQDTSGTSDQDLFTFAACLQRGGTMRLRYRENGKIFRTRVVGPTIKLAKVLRNAREWMSAHWKVFVSNRQERISNSAIRSFLANRPVRKRIAGARDTLANHIRETKALRQQLAPSAPEAPSLIEEAAEVETPDESLPLPQIEESPSEEAKNIGRRAKLTLRRSW